MPNKELTTEEKREILSKYIAEAHSSPKLPQTIAKLSPTSVDGWFSMVSKEVDKDDKRRRARNKAKARRRKDRRR